MDQKSHMNRILKKMYAQDLDLIESTPLIDITKKNPLKTLFNLLWTRGSLAIKVAIVALILAFISATVYYYNFFTINLFEVKREQAHIEAQLQRRKDLIPNLLTVVKNYSLYEKSVFIHAADVRAAVKSIEESLKEAEQIPPLDMSFLAKFQAVAEAYPALKASEAYQTLMEELSFTETQIADTRISFNKISNFYNSRLKLFPGNLFNLLLKFEPVQTFESESSAKSAPRVQ